MALSCGGHVVSTSAAIPLVRPPFAEEEHREGAQNVEAAPELFLRFLREPVDELEMVAHHPLRGAFGLHAAVKLEGSADGDHHPPAQMWLEHRHEPFLLRGPEGYPDDFSAVLFDHPGNRRVVESFDRPERQLHEPHSLDLGIVFFQVFPQAVEHGLLRAEENHSVAAAGDDVAENLAAAVLLPAFAVNPFYVERDVAAVAYREHPAVYNPQVVLVAVGRVENDPVGDADIVRPRLSQPPVDSPERFLPVKLVPYLEVCFQIQYPFM